MTDDSALDVRFSRLQMGALLVGAIAAIVAIIGALFDHAQFFRSYLFAWLYWAGFSFGSLVVVMMPVLSGGKWGAAVRGLGTAGFMTLPLTALLFIPILLGAHDIFGWSHGRLGEAPGYHHKAQYYTLVFSSVRSAVSFAVAILFALLVRNRLGRKNSSGGLAALSAGGLIAYVLCMNFSSTDWVMSLDPSWFTTIFVIIFVSGQFLSALALVTLLLIEFARADESIAKVIPTKVYHDLGNMLLAFTVFWAYVSFSQFLIIWSGNLPKEISWYLDRSRGGWQWWALALFLFHFLLPFFLLLSKPNKEDPRRLRWVCLCLLFAAAMENYWFVVPAFYPMGVHFFWLAPMEWLALGGLWFALFFWFLKRIPFLSADAISLLQDE